MFPSSGYNYPMINLVPGLFHNEHQTKKELCDFIMGTDRLSIGPECAMFEQQFAAWQGRKHAILFNSGSSANLALIQSLVNLGRIKAKNKAAFSAITWATNVMPLIQLGLEPVPVDIEISSLNVSSSQLLQTLVRNPNIKLLFLTNLLGFCGDLENIRQTCAENGIILIEDNCESLGSVYQGVKLGNWSLASTFSFFVGHHMSTIEGGAVCTDDDVLAEMLTLVRAHGWDRNLPPARQKDIRRRHGIANDFFANFTFYTPGYNFRPTEITGFLGQNQLQYLDTIIQRRQANFQTFSAALSANPAFIPLSTSHLDVVSNFAMPVICREMGQVEKYLKLFQDRAIEIRPIVGGSIPEQPFYQQLYGRSRVMPHAHLANTQGFYFANHEGLEDNDIRLICETILAPEMAVS